MIEFGASLPGSSFEQNNKGVQKRPEGWVDRNPSKKGSDTKRNPPSPSRHEDGRTRPKPGSRGNSK